MTSGLNEKGERENPRGDGCGHCTYTCRGKRQGRVHCAQGISGGV